MKIKPFTIKFIFCLLVLVLLYTPFAEAQALCGDLTADGSVDILDALVAARCYVQLIPCPQADTADVDCDGDIDILDALQIARYYVGLITSLNCCETPTPTPTPTEEITPTPTPTPEPETPTPTPVPDADNDGLLDSDEVIYGTEIDNPDTDSDGLLDGEEIHNYQSNPLVFDTDQDCASDGREVNEYGTDPVTPDVFSFSRPDLTVKNIHMDIPEIIAGQIVHIDVEIENIGCMEANDIPVKIITESNGNRTTLTELNIPILPDHAFEPVPFEWTNPVAGLQKIRVIIDESNVIEEINIWNNQDDIEVRVLPQTGVLEGNPDFQIAPCDIRFTPSYPSPSSNVEIEVTVRKGETSSDPGIYPVEVAAYRIQDEMLVPLGMQPVDFDLSETDSMTLEFLWSEPPSGSHNIRIILDEFDLIPENDELNNSADSSVDVSPLTITVSASQTSGPSPLGVQFNTTVYGGVPPFTYSWSFGDNSTGSISNPYHTYYISQTASPKTFNAKVIITDSIGSEGEVTTPISITNGPSYSPLPDLRVYFGSVSYNAEPGSVDIPVRIANWNGTSPVDARLVVALGFTHIYDRVVTVPNGSPYGETWVTITKTDLAAGQYTARAYINPEASIIESDFTNNEATPVTFQIVNGPVLPPISVSENDISFNPSTLIAGQRGLIMVELTNNSPGDRRATSTTSWEDLSGTDGGVAGFASASVLLPANGGTGTLFTSWFKVPNYNEVDLKVDIHFDNSQYDTSIIKRIPVELTDLEVVAASTSGTTRYGDFTIFGDSYNNNQINNSVPITIEAPIRNLGTIGHHIWVIFYIDNVEIQRNYIFVPGTETKYTSCVWQNPTAGGRTIKVALSNAFPSTVVRESDTTNNEAILPINVLEGPLQFQLTGFSFSPIKLQHGDNITIDFDIENEGQTSRNFTVQYYLKKKNLSTRTIFNQEDLGTIPAGITKSFTHNFVAKEIGKYALGVIVDTQSAEDTIYITPNYTPGRSDGVDFTYSLSHDYYPHYYTDYDRQDPGSSDNVLKVWGKAREDGKTTTVRAYIYKNIQVPDGNQLTYTTDIIIDGGFAGLVDTINTSTTDRKYYAAIKYGIVESDMDCWDALPEEKIGLWPYMPCSDCDNHPAHNGLWIVKSEFDWEEWFEELNWELLSHTTGAIFGEGASLVVDAVRRWYDYTIADEKTAYVGRIILPDVALSRNKNYKVFLGIDFTIEGTEDGQVYADFYNKAPYKYLPVQGVKALKGLWIDDIDFEFDPVWWGN